MSIITFTGESDKEETPVYIVPSVSHSLTAVPVRAVMVHSSNDSFLIREENPRVPAWEEDNRDYGMEMGHGRMQRDCKREERQSSSINQGRDWHILVTQQDKCWIQEC